MALSADPKTVAALLEAGGDPNARDEQGETPLHQAAQFTDRMNFDISDDSVELAEMIAATAASMPDIMAALVEAGADPDARDEQGQTPLHLAARRASDADIVSALMGADADPNLPDEKGQTALHLAVQFTGNPEIIAALIAGGADLTARDNYGSTPRAFAGENRKLEISVIYHQLNDRK